MYRASHKRLQISSEIIRTLRGRELRMIGGAGVSEVTIATTVVDCTSDDSVDNCTTGHVPPTTHGVDCKPVRPPAVWSGLATCA